MRPLSTYKELINWKPDNANNKCIFDYQKPIFQEMNGRKVVENLNSQRNKVLLCHDMKGGYLDDALTEKNEEIYAYRFYHWHLVDIFIYFSHNFITIPPTGWIYHSHRNGVQCLGTLIIEHDPSHENLKCFQDSDNVLLTAEKLTDIKNFYNFDGWLINIEVNIKDLNVVNNIKFFLSSLVELGNEVHWYDSITNSGHLRWQNGLNQLNKSFYDCCGNIFLNYCWNKKTLENSISHANGVINNIFVGIDCFGRGCYGGGGLNCCSALQLIEDIVKENHSKCTSKFSIALFAPGWCYESCKDKQEYDKNTLLFYQFIEKYLHPCLDGRSVYRQFPEINQDKNCLFLTNFDMGQGFHQFLKGELISKEPCNFLFNQSILPTGAVSEINTNVKIVLLPDRHVSYTGHSCTSITAEKSCRTEELLNESVNVELFRIGCEITKDFHISLLIVLGWRNTCIDIANCISVVLSFNEGDNDIRTKEFTLGAINAGNYRSDFNGVEWNVFRLDNLHQVLKCAAVNLTIRKISLKMFSSEIFKFLLSDKIFLGHLEIGH